MEQRGSGEITASVAVSNPGGTTPNFTAAISDLGAFLEDVRSQLQPASYAFVYDAEAEIWKLNGAEHVMKGITLTITDDSEDMLANGDTVTVTIAASVVIVSNKLDGVHDAVVDGVLYRGMQDKIIYVESEDDLDDLTDEQPGTFAATYGFTSMWQMGGSGSWVEITAAGEEET